MPDNTDDRMGLRIERHGGVVRVVMVAGDDDEEVGHVDYTPMQAAQITMNLLEAMKAQ